MINKLILFPFLISALTAAEIYVAPSGNDGNPGSQESPLATLEAARVKAQPFLQKESVTISVQDGVYYLPETLKLTAADSGTKEFPVVYRAANEGQAILSGGLKLDLKWSAYKDGIFQATTPAGVDIDQLFINGENQRMARYPNYDPAKKAVPYQGYSADAFSVARAKRWADPKGGYIHAMHRGGWGGYHYLITGKDENGEVTYEGGWQNNRKSGMHIEHRMVENIFEELDAEGEWFHQAETNTLYYKPTGETDLSKATVEVVRLRHLVEFNGSEEAPVKHISFQGFTVRHAARTFMDTKEQLVRSDWAIYRGGAFFLTGTEGIKIADCEFDQVGGNAVFVNNYSRDVLVTGCHIHHTGGSGVCFVGDPDALYNPLFEYGERNDLTKIDLTVGPKTNNYPRECTVENSLIHNIGTVERQPAGVQIEMAAKITARDLSVYDCARAGINIGDGAFGGHLIERVDVFDTVLETHDHGSFNSWGRDRYWRADHLTASQEAVDANPELPFLDAMYTTTICNSRWRCEHGWDVDLDDGSSNYDLYNNLMLCGGLKLREGFRRKAWNNIVVNNGLSSHVWFQNSNDDVSSNVMASANGPYIIGEVTVDGLVNKNFYYKSSEGQLKNVQEKFGWDRDSILGENPFVDEANGDYTVKAGSRAFETGFKNFPMDQFGVKKPSLKKIARVPKFGAKEHKPRPKVEVEMSWLGAELKALEGTEFSAYGVTEREAGLAVRALPETSALQTAGVQANDLIQRVNGESTPDVRKFNAAISSQKGKTLKLSIIRNQQPVEVTLPAQS